MRCIKVRKHPGPIGARTISGRDIIRAYVERLPWEMARIQATGRRVGVVLLAEKMKRAD